MPDSGELREAFRQGYVRGMLHLRSAVHAAFRKGWNPAEVEALLERMAQASKAEAEAAAYVEWHKAGKGDL